MKIHVLDQKYYDLHHQLSLDDEPEILLANEIDLKDVEYIVEGRMTKENFDAMPRLKVVAIPFAGLNRMDLAEAHKRGIKVINTHVHSCFVAEKAVTLALSMLGNITSYHDKMKVGNWSDRNNPQTRTKWDSMHNKRVGIYGYGHIGQYIHRLLKPYNCDVYAIDRGKIFEDVTLVKGLPALAEASDIVFVSVPINDSTIGVFDKNVLEHMKGSYLVNIARGNVVVEEELYNALTNNELKGFASDVWYEYPNNEFSVALPSRYPIHLCENVVMSPHCATATFTAHSLMLEDVVQKLVKIDRREAVELVDIEKNLLSSKVRPNSLG